MVLTSVDLGVSIKVSFTTAFIATDTHTQGKYYHRILSINQSILNKRRRRLSSPVFASLRATLSIVVDKNI